MTTPLITRLEEAAEGSRELDVAVYAHVKGIADDIAERHWPLSPVTTSIDAALALAERVLPGVWWTVRAPHRRVAKAALYPSAGPVSVGRARNPALALCIAILRANHKDKT